MKRKILSYLLLFMILITGCSSFNNSFNTYTIPNSANTKTTETNSNKGTDEAALESIANDRLTDARCANYIFPPIPIPPVLPINEIVAANGNVMIIERIERKHIDDLRLFISITRKEQSQAQSEYQALCDKEGKS